MKRERANTTCQLYYALWRNAICSGIFSLFFFLLKQRRWKMAEKESPAGRIPDRVVVVDLKVRGSIKLTFRMLMLILLAPPSTLHMCSLESQFLTKKGPLFPRG